MVVISFILSVVVWALVLGYIIKKTTPKGQDWSDDYIDSMHEEIEKEKYGK